jgi:hypothetical protein
VLSFEVRGLWYNLRLIFDLNFKVINIYLVLWLLIMIELQWLGWALGIKVQVYVQCLSLNFTAIIYGHG